MLKTVRGPLILFVFTTLFANFSAPAQNAPSAASAHTQFFSGYVTEFSANSIQVIRKATPGREAVRKIFVIDGQTKIEGKLRSDARVTVRFENTPAGERAIRIIVRG